MEKSFFEFLGIAHMERMHSQMLAWIFSDTCDALNINSKVNLLNKIFKLDGTRKILNIQTENSGIDILIETSKEIIIVENKIKSSQHSNQLIRYEDYCDKNFNSSNLKYYYLTLIDEDSSNEKWTRISYDKIYIGLNSISFVNNNHKIILDEYLKYLSKLSSVILDFKNRTKEYDMVFLDGKKKKSEKINCQYNSENEKFIAENQLKTILQKCFLNSIRKNITSVTSHVTDTRGDALIDFHIKNGLNFQGRNYSTIIQLQGNVIKFAFSIYGKEYTSSKKHWIESLFPIMEALSFESYYGYSKCNKPKSKAYISLSKKLEKNYWHLSTGELTNFINEEIQNGRELTKILETHLNSHAIGMRIV